MGCCKCEEYKWRHPQEPIATDSHGNAYCLFHAPAHLKEGRHEELVNAVRAYIQNSATSQIPISRFIINHQLTGIVFSDTVNLEKLQLSALDISHATFHGDVTFEHSKFSRVTSFENCEFHGRTNFDYATFESNVTFKKSLFNGRTTFYSTEFSAMLSMEESRINDATSIMFSTITGFADFTQLHIDSTITFGMVSFLENLNISKSSIHGTLTLFKCNICEKESSIFYASHISTSKDSNFYITHSTINGMLNFSECEINGILDMSSTIITQRAYFEDSNIGFAKFKNCVIKDLTTFDRVDLRRASFSGAPIENFRMIACRWPTSSGRRLTYDARKLENCGYLKIDNTEALAFPPQKKPDKALPPQHLEDLYRRIKKTAREGMDETLTSDFHYAEKEMQRLRGFQQFRDDWACRHSPDAALPIKERLRGLGLYLTLLCYKLTSGYGEAPGQAALWLLFLTFGAPLIGLLIPPAWCPASLAIPLHIYGANLGDKWLHFLPLVKLPDADAAGWLARFLMLLSQVAITLQAALFGFALRNRFRR
ncbi:pentapeptide repeat-containing protein [Nitratidesulfovibrio sp. HK-II]|uniref:pentapeptide repeat-containing protein n=1 Tax=Nitratidesulfovibrio sp. HK-II TaxID=2009266 RepID=UPI000E2EF688|nr:pentapeptide repeat-containing protein [Nitratidesulfovibrio sp. HK-II]GBO96148.1 putative integral membrane protein [Nitratidesulfovibrio sp. HK-II]